MNYMKENKLDVGAIRMRFIHFRTTYIDKSQRQAAKDLEVAKSILSKAESGERPINLTLFNAFVTKFGMDPTWAITGEGSPILEKPAKSNLLTDISAINCEITVLKQYIKVMEVRHNRLSDLVDKLQKQIDNTESQDEAAKVGIPA